MMIFIKRWWIATWNLFWKELRLEFRQKYALGGILLYVISTVFIVYFAFINIPKNLWNALFWIIVLFASVNAVAKSFIQENNQRALYYYTLAGPSSVIASKIIHNIILLLGINLLTFGIMSLISNNPVRENGLFSMAIFLGSIGFATALTFISAIASKAKNGATLMAILSFPIIIPLLITLIKITASALGSITDTSVGKDLTILFALDFILITVAILLFPFLWRE